MGPASCQNPFTRQAICGPAKFLDLPGIQRLRRFGLKPARRKIDEALRRSCEEPGFDQPIDDTPGRFPIQS